MDEAPPTLKHTLEHKELVFQGIPASPGIAIAPIHVLAHGFDIPELYLVENPDAEIQRLQFALERTKQQLSRLREKLENLSGDQESEIFEAHQMILEDHSLIEKVSKLIRTSLHNAEYCFYSVTQNYLEAMRRIPDAYLQERAIDIADVGQRVLENFQIDASARKNTLENQHILVTYDITPSDTAELNRRHVLGFAAEQGSINSHSAILARALGIPAVLGLDSSILEIAPFSLSILDGYSGKLILNPSPETQKHYEALSIEKNNVRKALEAYRDLPTKTTDNHTITLSANVELVDELPMVQRSSAKGIGLYRTEFLLLEHETMPNEDKQTEVYTELVRGVAPHTVIIRTLDAGGDKLPLEQLNEPEPNPFLGWRGIRVSLSRPLMFKEQLRAILRASAHGKIAVMFPMISGISEIKRAKIFLRECMEELTKAKIPFNPNIPVGIMIEVPSAAVIADLLAPEVDFFSIGTNDLIQYAVAVDRGNARVADLYRPTHLGVLRLIKNTIQAAQQNNIWTGVCGEMAGDIRLTPLLIGLGIEELSVGPQLALRVAQAIRSLNYEECKNMAQQALSKVHSYEILNLSLSLARRCYPELLD